MWIFRQVTPWLLGLIVCEAAAQAEPSPEQREHARAALVEGYQRFDQGEYEQALPLFDAAAAVVQVPTTFWAKAQAQERLGRLVDARRSALQAAEVPEAPNEPTGVKDARFRAAQFAREVSARIPKLRIAVGGSAVAPQHARVLVDGATLTNPAAPVEIDPGTHIVLVRAEGFHDASASVTVGEGVTQDVRVTLVATTLPAAIEPPQEGVPILAWVGFGFGGAGVVAGTVTGALSWKKTSDLKAVCPSSACPPEYRSERESAKRLAWASDFTLGIGAVGLALGTYALLTAPTGSAQPQPKAFEARIGPRAFAIAGSF